MFDWFHNKVPYTDFQQKNLDWLTETVREGEAAVEAKIEEADTAIANAEAATTAANTAKTGADTAAASANAAATAANNAKDAANTAAAHAEASAVKYGSPLTSNTVAGMTDQTRIYVYTGSEVGYTAGNWYYWNGTAWTSGGSYVYNDEAVDLIEQMSEALTTDIYLSPTSIEENKIYSNSYHNGLTLSGYNTYNFDVEVGKTYYITTSVISASGYAVCYGFKNGTWAHTYGDYPDYSGAVSDYELTVQGSGLTDINSIKVTVINGVVPSVKYIGITTDNVPSTLTKIYNNCVMFSDNECYVKAKYDDDHDICIRINKGGGNNLPDIRYIYLTDNEGDLNTSAVSSRSIVSNSTDILSPIEVYANQDADGDHPSNEYFTGGNHRSNNTGTGGGITATNTSFEVYCDGKPVTDWVFGKKVLVKWVNLINGYNTSKDDGTGRNIIQEEITLTIEGNRIEADIIHIALESLTVNTYYGLQMYCNDLSTIRYYGGTSRNIYNPKSASNSGNKNCRVFVLKNATDDTIELGLYPIDVGDFSMDNLSYSAFTTSAKKAYFGTMYNAGLVLAPDDAFEVRGYFEFRPGLTPS